MRYRWTRKPPFGTRIDRSNPITRGLLGAWFLNEGAGRPVDATAQLTMTALGSPSWGFGQHGNALRTDATDAGYFAYLPSLWFPATVGRTVVWSGAITGTPSANANLFAVYPANPNAVPYIIYGVTVSGSGTLRAWAHANSPGYIETPSGTSAANRGQTWMAYTHADGAQALYLDNPRTAAATRSAGVTSSWSYAGNESVAFGAFPGVTGRNSACRHDYGMVWNRVLSVAELVSIHANPWQVLLGREWGLSGDIGGGGTATGSGSITLAVGSFAGVGGFSAPSSGALTLGAGALAGVGRLTSPSSGAVTLGPGTLAGVGRYTATASGSPTLAAGTLSAAGLFTATANGSVALAAGTLAGTATATAPGNSTATGAITLAALTAAGSGAFSTSAAGPVTLAAGTLAGIGRLTVSATGALTLSAGTLAGSGSAGSATATGTGAVTLAALSVAGSGRYTATASGSVALAAGILAGYAPGPALLAYPDPFLATSTVLVNPFIATSIEADD